jgi:hypothetical protein
MYVDLASPFLAKVFVDGREIEATKADDEAGYADELMLEKNTDRPGSRVVGIERRFGAIRIEKIQDLPTA